LLKEQLYSQDALEIQGLSSTNDVSHHHTWVPVFGKEDNGRDLSYSFEHNPENLESLLCTFVDPCLLDFSRTSNSARLFILSSFYSTSTLINFKIKIYQNINFKIFLSSEEFLFNIK